MSERNLTQSQKNSFLFSHASRGAHAAARQLLAEGARPNQPRGGSYPLIEAARVGDAEMCQMLVEHGAKVGSRSSLYDDMTPLHLAAGPSYTYLGKEAGKRMEACRVLIEAGADVHARDRHGNTSLMYARTEDVCRYLVECGSELEATNAYGKTASQRARDAGAHKVADYLDSLAQTRDFERDTAAVMADTFNPMAESSANAVQSDTEAPARRQRMRL